jgi:hypothetical protein
LQNQSLQPQFSSSARHSRQQSTLLFAAPQTSEAGTVLPQISQTTISSADVEDVSTGPCAVDFRIFLASPITNWCAHRLLIQNIATHAALISITAKFK